MSSMDNAITMQIVLTILGSGAFFSFLQFLIQRKDSKEDKNINERFDQLEKKIQSGLEEREKTGVERFNKLEKKIQEGLDEREKTGAERFNIHDSNIKNLIKNHNEDLKKLLDTLEQFKSNDLKVEQALNKIANSQNELCKAVVGLAHDKLVFMTDKIIERGAITIKEKATLDSIYIPYQAMGGNSHAKAGYEQSIKLPVISDEKAKELDELVKVKRNQKAIKDDDEQGKAI